MLETSSLDSEQADLLQLLYLCPVALARLDAAGNIILMNPYGPQLLMPISGGAPVTNLFNLLERFAPEVAEMARRFDARAGRVCEEHRIPIPAGSVSAAERVLSITLQKVNPDTFVAVLSDVTQAALREFRVRESEERLHAVIDGLKNDAICTLSLDGIVTSWNKAAERLDDFRRDEVMGRPLELMIGAASGPRGAYRKSLDAARKTGADQFESWRIRKDGRRYWARTSIALILEKDGVTPSGFSCITQDLTEERRAEDRLRTMATTDSLTGALNRRAFFDLAGRELRQDDATNSAVLLLDADRFKTINDTFGHEAGDTVLVRIVNDCRREIRSQDLLGRLGGEEFAIFLASCDIHGARDAAERIRARIATVPPAGGIAVTVSIGIAVGNETGEGIESLIRRADSAMYEGKNSGRDRVVEG